MHWNKAIASWTEGPREYITYKMEMDTAVILAMPLRPRKSARRKNTLSVSRTPLSSRVLVRSSWSRVNTTVTHLSGVLTLIIRWLGVFGVEVKEVVSIGPDGIEHMRCGRDS